MDKQIELKPCPFCGEKAILSTWKGCYIVGCDTEMCFGNINHVTLIGVDKEFIVKQWNRRANNG